MSRLLSPMLYPAVMSVALMTLVAVPVLIISPPAWADGEKLETVFVNPSDRRDVSVGDVRFLAIGELTRLDFSLTNTTRRERRFEYRLVWSDTHGTPAQTLTTWRSLTLLPRESHAITSVSQQTAAVNAELTIREIPLNPPSR